MARVLIIERVQFMCDITRFALQYGGHEVIGEAHDGQEGLDSFNRLKPDLVILSLILQKYNGMQVLASLKNNNSNAHVIICSAVRRQDMIDKAMELGADSYIIKPFQIQNFLKEVDRVLGVERVSVHPDEISPVKKDELNEIMGKILTKTISPAEVKSFLQKMKS